MIQLTTRSAEETQNLARRILQGYPNYHLYALIGELGTGKTTLVQGLASELGIKKATTSPTYLIMKTYPIPDHSHFRTLIHLDLYRINDWADIDNLGIDELWQEGQNLIVIEWADRIKKHLPPQYLEIQLLHLGPEHRQLKITPHT